jgi:hypothetical protein
MPELSDRERALAALRRYLDSGDAAARSAAREAVDVLGRRGFLAYRDLFRP